MGVSIPQSSFTSGELAPSLYGRIDFQRYYSGLRTCRNFIVQQFGGVVNRSGTLYCGSAYDQTKRVRLVPFQFSPYQQYVLEFGHLYVRIWYQGALVVDGGGNPIKLTTPYQSSDLVTQTDIDLIKYVQSADVMTICHQSYPPQQLSRLAATSWSLASFVASNGPFQELNTVTANTVKASAVTGSVTLTASASIFLPSHVGCLMKIQEMPDNVTPEWEVAVAVHVNDIVVAEANYYQAQNSGTTGTIKPTATEGSQRDGNTGIIWNYLHSGFGIAKITAVASGTSATATVMSRLPDSVVSATVMDNVTNVIPSPSDGGSPPSPTGPITINIPNHNFITGATVTVAGVTGTTGANGTWTITVTDANNFTLNGTADLNTYTGGGTVTNTAATTPSYLWAFSAWGADQGYPMSVGFSQQREIFAATPTQSQGVWFSRVAGYADFGVSVPLLDDDAITYTISSRRVNEIRHILELTSLVLFTSDGPFVVNSGKSGQSAITPNGVDIKRQGQNGVAHVPPLLVNEGALFVQEKGAQVRSLAYSFESDAFVGNDLTVLSNHLFAGHQIIDWCYQETPNYCIWAVREDGVLLGLTSMPQQQVVAWHRHDTDGAYESVCCVSENDQDIVYAAVKRTINGQSVRYIERFDSRSFTDFRDAFFVDCGLSYDGRNTGATTVTVSGGTTWDETDAVTLAASTGIFASTNIGDQIQFIDPSLDADGNSVGITYRLTITAYTDSQHVTAALDRLLPAAYQNAARTDWGFAKANFSGLNHLEGKTVNILADGLDFTPQIVTNGTITLDHPAVVVHAGLPIVSDFETLEINSSQGSIRDRKQLMKHVSLILNGSPMVQAGPDPNHLLEYKARQFENYDQATFPMNKLVDVNIQATWQKAGRIFVRQDRPLPLCILSAIPQVEVGGV